MEDRFSIPSIEGSLTGGPYAAVERCKEHILATAESLLPFWHMPIDSEDNFQFFSDIPQGSQSPELENLCLQRFCGFLLQATQQRLWGTQVHEDDRSRFPVDSPGFDDLPVGMTTGDFLLGGGHADQCIQLISICQEKSFRRSLSLRCGKVEHSLEAWNAVLNNVSVKFSNKKRISRFEK